MAIGVLTVASLGLTLGAVHLQTSSQELLATSSELSQQASALESQAFILATQSGLAEEASERLKASFKARAAAEALSAAAFDGIAYGAASASFAAALFGALVGLFAARAVGVEDRHARLTSMLATVEGLGLAPGSASAPEGHRGRSGVSPSTEVPQKDAKTR